MFNLEATIAKIESQVIDPDDRRRFLTRLKDQLAERRKAAAFADNNYTPENLETTGTDTASEQLRTGTQVGRGGTLPEHEQLRTGTDAGPVASDSLRGETDSGAAEPNWDAIEAQLAALPEDLRDVAEHLHEKVHHRSPFARLTSDQRRAILDLFEHHSGPEMVAILAKPPPIGFNLKTSKQALSRFRRDHMRYEMNNAREMQKLADEAARKAADEAFHQANVSADAFCQATERNIRRRHFDATRNPAAHYQEIRWLITSLVVLRSQYASSDPAQTRESQAPT